MAERLEEKVVVLSSPFNRRLEKYLLAIPGTRKIKSVRQNDFFWVDNGQSARENVTLFKETIKKTPGGGAILFKVFPVFNGKIDLTPDVPESKKISDAYFQDPKKDITEEELQALAA